MFGGLDGGLCPSVPLEDVPGRQVRQVRQQDWRTWRSWPTASDDRLLRRSLRWLRTTDPEVEISRADGGWAHAGCEDVERATPGGGRRYFRLLTAADRRRTLAAEDALTAAAADYWQRQGWHRHELPEVIYAEARRVGVYVWPALAERIVAEVASRPPQRASLSPLS
jgi:hypothetical protein